MKEEIVIEIVLVNLFSIYPSMAVTLHKTLSNSKQMIFFLQFAESEYLTSLSHNRKKTR